MVRCDPVFRALQNPSTLWLINFNTVASVALYTLIPVLSTKLTAGLRESVTSGAATKWQSEEMHYSRPKLLSRPLQRHRPRVYRLRKRPVTLARAQRQNAAAGINVGYQKEMCSAKSHDKRVRIAETAAIERLVAANSQLSLSARAASVATGLARGAFSLIGGPVGAAMLAGSALLYFS